MCGIAALLHHRFSPEAARDIIVRSLLTISHRGEPRYQAEIWQRPGFVGGANRLALTSEREPQPAQDSSGQLRVFLNGEIYSLHSMTEVREGRWSDTRALAEIIGSIGIARAIAECEGMYALVVVDEAGGRAWLARDPIGIKPLYFSRTQHGFLIASEIKALVVHDFVEEIEHVPPGALVEIRPGEIRPAGPLKLWKSRDSAEPMSPSALRDALMTSVEKQTGDGHDYAVYLSGGLDSSTVYACARAMGRSVTPIVLGTRSASDVAAAVSLTTYFGDEIEIVQCPGESELVNQLPEVVRICESFEPNVVRQSAVTKVLAGAAANLGFRVALCGEGADELFGGYPEFWSGSLPFEQTRTKFLRDLHRTQLQRVDRMNMAATVEVRVPFLSAAVAELALQSTCASVFRVEGTHPTEGKRPLRDAMHGLLPDEILMRPKIVLSEGAGLRGNSPETGVFSSIVANMIEAEEASMLVQNYPSWALHSREEAFYFRFFKGFGYDRYCFSKNRVFANRVETIRQTE